MHLEIRNGTFTRIINI